MDDRARAYVYTTQDQSEQPETIHGVTAVALTGGLLTMECDVIERGHSFSAFHRFEPGRWTRFTIGAPRDKESSDDG